MEKQPEDVRSVLAELLRLYNWRNELGRIERDFNHDKKQMKTWLNQYGREKKAAWEAAVRVLSVPPSAITAEQLAEVKDQCEKGLLTQHQHQCPATFALSAIYADLFAKT